MSDLAFLTEGARRGPLVVRLGDGGDGLTLTYPDGGIDKVPWWRLFRRGPDGPTQIFRRIDNPHWMLSISSASHRQLLSGIGRRRLPAIFGRFRPFYSVKLILGAAFLLLTLVQSIPASWIAPWFPESAGERITEGVLAQHGPKQCASQQGEGVLRKLLTALDPKLAREVEITGLDYGGFVVTAAPGRNVIVHRPATAEIDAYALAALLAHQLSHVRHGDAHVAMVRQNGVIGTIGAWMQSSERSDLRLAFSPDEEERADREALVMMQRARLPIAPAAELFEQLRKEDAARSEFALPLRRFHPGLPQRVRDWRAAADGQRTARSILSQEELDALFNFCWPGQILPGDLRGRPGQPARSDESSPTNVDYGFGAIGPDPDDMY